MSEPGNMKISPNHGRSAVDRAKSIRDINEQYSRIDNRLYRRYLDYDIEEDEYLHRKQKLNDTYDRYEKNIVNDPNWHRGLPYPKGFDYNRKVSRKEYTK